MMDGPILTINLCLLNRWSMIMTLFGINGIYSAKKRILMDTIEVTAVPMAAYYIEQNMTNKGSFVSSLGSTVAST